MGRTFLFTLGWNIEPILGTFTRHALRNGDEVIFVVPKFKDERTEKAIITLKEHLESLGLIINIKMLELPTNFEQSVIIIQDALKRTKNPEIIVNISGGMRYIVLATYTAILLSDRSRIILDELTIEGKKQTIPLKLPPLIKYTPTPEEKAILQALADGEKDINQLANILDKKITKTSLWKKLNKLSKLGIVKVKKEGKRNIYILQTWIPKEKIHQKDKQDNQTKK